MEKRVDQPAATFSDGVGRIAHRMARLALHTFRLCAYAVLVILRPLLIPVLTWLAVGGLALWVVFVPVAHDPDFPALRVLGMSVGCGIGAVLYYATLEFLMPGSLGHGR